MLFKNDTKEAKNVRQIDEKGNYFWKWIEPNQEIDLDVEIAEKYGLTCCETKSVKKEVSNVVIETKRVETKSVKESKKKR
jgi:tRNA U34 5-methylaminomethyl-2-thiouridine-forming methyltransferase MnmC